MPLKMPTLAKRHLTSPGRATAAQPPSHTAARLLMSILFLVSGTSKLGAPAQTAAYMEAYGVPGYLLYPAAALEIGGGGMLLADFDPRHTRWLAMVLAGWCLLTASIFHTELTDQEQRINFLKNLAMAGGFLVLAGDQAVGKGKDNTAESGREAADMGNGEEAVGGGAGGAGRSRSGQKPRIWRPKWATWSEALADAGPDVLPDTKEWVEAV